LSIDGILNINKPAGKTSFEVVALVRRLSGERRVGHGGTLDPEATGVLPIGLGRGTRVTAFLAEESKVYQAQVELGTATDTYDASGKITCTGDVSTVTREQVEAALASFRGLIEQIPPLYSALKYQGQPLYRLARAGIEVPRPPRKVNIFRLELLHFELPLLTLEVTCSKGTYIRSLAHDLGQALGCGAHLKSLVRLKSGPFHLSEAVSLPQLEDAFRHRYWQLLLHPLDVVLLRLMAIIVGEENERAIVNGRPLLLPGGNAGPSQGRAGELYRAYSRDGRLIALLRCDGSTLQAEKVLATS
jgi:tRNA pseudouridine55 synthase